MICRDRRRRAKPSTTEARGTGSVTTDIDRLFAPKSFDELETLERQVKGKLDSDEPIDYDYWEQLLRNLRVWKAKAKLKKVSQEILSERLQALRKQQQDVAIAAQEKLKSLLKGVDISAQDSATPSTYGPLFDPQPSLKLRAEEKNLEQTIRET